MSFWSGEKLLQNQSVVENFNPDQIDTNAYNFKMGNCYFVTGNGEDRTKVFLEPKQPFIIPPGQFAYLMSHEELNVPANAMAFISIRTGIKFNGLINVSGFHVDPGYTGKLVYAAYNASPSPLQICEGDEIFKVWFVDLDQESDKKHLFQGDGKAEIGNGLIRGMSKELYSLQSVAEKIRSLETKMDSKFAEQKSTADNLTTVWGTISTGVVVALIFMIFTLAFPTITSMGTKIDDYFFGETSVETTLGNSLADTAVETIPGKLPAVTPVETILGEPPTETSIEKSSGKFPTEIPAN